MSDVGLDRADQQRLGSPRCRSDDGTDGPELDGVAGGGARTVGFDVVDGAGVDAGVGIRPPQHLFLAGLAGSGQEAAAATVVGDRAAADDGIDVIAGGPGARQALQGQHHRSIAPDESVGRGVAELAATVGSHEPRLRVRDRDERLDDDVGTAGERDIALLRRETLARKVHGHERRRARGVHRDARAQHVEEVRQPAGRGVAARARGHVEVDVVGVREEPRLVLVEPHPDIDAGGGTREPLARDAGILERLPRRLQEEPLLRVEPLSLPRRDLEEPRVDAVDPVDEAAEAAHDPPRRRRSLVEERLGVEPVSRDRGDGVDALDEDVPQR
jgi:hypothetical protein